MHLGFAVTVAPESVALTTGAGNPTRCSIAGGADPAGTWPNGQSFEPVDLTAGCEPVEQAEITEIRRILPTAASERRASEITRVLRLLGFQPLDIVLASIFTVVPIQADEFG